MHAVANCYAPTFFQTYGSSSFSFYRLLISIFVRADNALEIQPFHWSYEQDAECKTNEKVVSQEKIDRILDKIRKSGYDSLTQSEKQMLFDQSNK